MTFKYPAHSLTEFYMIVSIKAIKTDPISRPVCVSNLRAIATPQFFCCCQLQNTLDAHLPDIQPPKQKQSKIFPGMHFLHCSWLFSYMILLHKKRNVL